MNSEHIRAAAFAFWSYDEEHCVDKINEAFKGKLKPHFFKNPDGSHFYGYVTDAKTGTVYGVNRGTDGDDRAGNLHSWLYNANVFTGRDGMHNGFEKRGNIVFDTVKPVLPRFRRVVWTGQSQGASVSQITAKLSCENLSADKPIEFVVFAAPPPGNRTFADTMTPYFVSGRLIGTRYTMPGDPIASKVLRNPNSCILNGVDNGSEIVLPDLIQYRIGPAETVNHSCRMYAAGMLMQMALDGARDDEYELMGKIFKWCVN